METASKVKIDSALVDHQRKIREEHVKATAPHGCACLVCNFDLEAEEE